MHGSFIKTITTSLTLLLWQTEWWWQTIRLSEFSADLTSLISLADYLSIPYLSHWVISQKAINKIRAQNVRTSDKRPKLPNHRSYLIAVGPNKKVHASLAARRPPQYPHFVFLFRNLSAFPDLCEIAADIRIPASNTVRGYCCWMMCCHVSCCNEDLLWVFVGAYFEIFQPTNGKMWTHAAIV